MKMIFHLVILQFLIHLACFTNAQNPSLDHYCFPDGNYTENSSYKANLDTLLTSLSPNIQSNGFYNASVGQNADRANAIALCRGDVQVDTCRACITNATQQLLQDCPTQKSAIVWYDFCMLGYSNSSIVGTVNALPNIQLKNTQNVSDVDRFNSVLQTLLEDLRGKAAYEGSLTKYASGNSSQLPDFQYLYGFVQCTPDLSADQCSSCLISTAQQIITFVNGALGGRIFGPSCHLRYELAPFLNQTVLLEEDPQSGGDNNSTKIIIAIVIPLAALIVIGVGVVLLMRKNKKKNLTEQFEIVEDISTVESLQYDFNTISIATGSFDDSNKLGQGGFGAVYKGCLTNGQEIAVKRLAKGSGQGDLEFKNEVALVARLQHRNLVRLLGFCLEGTERLLIYEYMPNASLDQFIFGLSVLNWIGIRGTKSYEVLREDSFIFMKTRGFESFIGISSGYMAPEYALHGLFSPKSDVFSYGVLVLEIVSGQRNNLYRNGDNVGDLLSHVWKNWKDGTTANVIDPVILSNSASIHELVRCIHIGLLCVQENDAARPTMESVLLMLNSFSLTLQVPSEPAFYMRSDVVSEVSSLSEDTYTSSKMLQSKLLR